MLVATLNAIDTANSTIATERAVVETARNTIQTSREARRTLNGNLDADIRDVNTNGLGGTISSGFLDAVGAGMTEDFEWTGGSGNRRKLSFTYDKDSDTLSNIVYSRARKARNTGNL